MSRLDFVALYAYFFKFYLSDGGASRRFLYKIKIYLNEDFWNIYDILAFTVFYAAVVFRFIPKTSVGCISSTESCFECGNI